MERHNKYFRVYPKIVHANKDATIKIEPIFDNVKLVEEADYRITHYPVDYSTKDKPFTQTIKPIDGCLHITQYFEGEQEHILYISEIIDEKVTREVEFKIYSLEEDLFAKRPYKGDMHMHTYYSDGHETPAYVTASCRKIGLDFMAITDHGLYRPSIEAQEAFEGVDVDLRIYRGEEIHPPENPVHMINFGGDFSVNELIAEDEQSYRGEVAEIEKNLTHIPDDRDRYQVASCIWCFNKIREGGGMGIFCHPFWRIKSGYAVSTLVTQYLYDCKPFDAMEAIGGFIRSELESNVLQVASYNNERARGRDYPIVGVSDAHGCETDSLFGWYYTVVFSESLELHDLIENIKDHYSVAMEAVSGERIWAHGDFRLVKYALFLEREVFPLHDELCKIEGALMLEYIKGDEGAKQELTMRSGKTKELYDMLWAK